MKEKKPGILSPELSAALGMQDGAPPPWLINMQRYGPPPSYPTLRIPGLNAPLPPGASYGYQPGGWGKPPVDEYGRPLYGDVFGTSSIQEYDAICAGIDKKALWGSYEVQEEEEEEEGDEEEESEEEEDEDADVGAKQRAVLEGEDDGLATPATFADNGWIDTTESIVDLRKRIGGLETPDTNAGGAPRELYQIMKETKVHATGGQIFGSDRLYSLPGQNGANGDTSVQLGSASTTAAARDGMDTEEDALRGSRKRKAESSLVSKKAKEFKF